MIIPKILLIDKLSGWIMLVLSTIVFCVITALMIFPQKSEMESIGAPKKTEQPKIEQHQISDSIKFQAVILQQQLEILRLQACSDAKLPQTECEINWNAGIVMRRSTAPKK